MSHRSDGAPWWEPPEARFNVPRWGPAYLRVSSWARMTSWLVVVVLSQVMGGRDGLPAVVMVLALPAFAIVLADVFVFARRWYLNWLYVRNDF